MTSRGQTPDRVAGVVLVAIGLATALEARTFVVSFVTDPLGPKALPFLVAAILGLSGATLLLRPGESTEWPGLDGWKRIGLATASLLAYSLVLESLGFFVSTTTAVTALALLFEGRPLKSMITAAVFTGALYVLFVFVLQLSLPIGTLFLRRG